MTVQGTGWKNDLLIALCATLVVLTINAVSGFPTLADYGGDNDSMLTLVEVRDLLAGQSWFDLHQYRMGLSVGFVMHWSRLVDGPIALIIMTCEALGASAETAERAARIFWPTLLYGLTIFVLMRAARRFAGTNVAMPAVILSTAALFFLVIFSPGVIDHHNIQLFLTAACLCLLMEAPYWRPAALLSGICAGLTLAVGMETAPYVAVLGSCAAALFIVDAKERATARGFGLGFAGIASIVFVATIRSSDWGVAQCDAFSSFQFAVAALSGLGLAIASAPVVSTARARFIWMLALAVAIAAVIILFFPQCLALPYSNIGERLRNYWMSDVVEAQPFWIVATHQPKLMAARYITPFIAILLIGFELRGGRLRREQALVAVLLVVAFGISLWQVRASTFSVAFAVLPLSAWVAKIRLQASTTPPSWRLSTRMVAAWLVSLNATWAGVAVAAQSAIQKAPLQQANSDADHAVTCGKAGDFRDLAALPATTVLASANLGAAILAFTPHRALAGTYHRNIGGNLAMIDAFTGTPDAAYAIIQREHVGLVAICRGNTEESALAAEAPAGFAALLLRGAVPDWLELDRSSVGKPIEIYKVR